MSEKDMINLKEQLDNEMYSKITFSQKEKQRVWEALNSSGKGMKGSLLQKIIINVGAAVVFAGMGTFVFHEVMTSQESSVEQATDVPGKNLNKDLPQKTTTASEDTVNDKAWEDRTITEGLGPYDAKTVKEFIAQHAELYSAPLPEQYADDPEHYHWIEATVLLGGLELNYKVEGAVIEKDFHNLNKLTSIVVEEHKKRYEHLNLKNENPFDYKDQFKAPSERMKQAHAYIAGLLNDLNIAINKEGKGANNGYSYMLDGNKTNELESFIRND
ncbi:hypothetical protein [Mesobacillus selenatarsenatis]|uniref:Uncharacterized protein n=1 Tax=Mesobacillus selenatarsenatis TaxID=388741 RepID=A0A846U0E0_9BACI|nr:hypothetical protein [Mesobacillus selenatarsenatis]NKE08121.1 hypothetical protein [Mesobacillus selenatarsenatis]